MARKQKPKVHNDSCPNCGYCPHCGRSDAPKTAPVYVPVWPWWNQPTYVGPICIGGGGNTTTVTSAGLDNVSFTGTAPALTSSTLVN